MSLSFPASPTNGQIYQNWVWSSAVGAWQPNYAAGFVNSFNGRGGVVTLQPSDNTAGNRVLLMSQIVAPTTPVALVNFIYTFTNAYDVYELDFHDFQNDTATGSTFLQCRFSTDGSTFDTSANYYNIYSYAISSASGGTNSAVGGQSFLYLTAAHASFGASSYTLGNGVVRLTMPWVTDRNKYLTYTAQSHAQAGVYWQSGVGYWNNANAIKGISLFLTTGNITRGVFNLYGRVKSGAGGS